MNERLYHQVPKDMTGTEIMPLSDMKDAHPDLYERQIGKYKDREDLLERHVPGLNCSRKDLVYLSAVHPSLLKEALEKCGRKELFNSEYFEIDPIDLDREKTAVDMGGSEDIFEEFDPYNISKYGEIPEETLVYYREQFAKGEHPFIHYKIPQILYKGKIDISKAKRIKI